MRLLRDAAGLPGASVRRENARFAEGIPLSAASAGGAALGGLQPRRGLSVPAGRWRSLWKCGVSASFLGKPFADRREPAAA